MKIYKVKVNGKVYEVELESVIENNASIQTTQVVENKPELTDGLKIIAPMQGTILNINVKVGDNVKKGQVLMILEAMKLENEIVCPSDGVVKAINVLKGETVNNGKELVVIG